MWFYIDSMEKTHTHKKNRREDHGGWRRAHCRNAHVLHCLLKIILSADLLPFLKLGSITNSHTNNPNSERGKKLVQNHGKNKKKVSPHVTCPASPQTLSMGPNFLFFCFFLVFSRLLPPWPKNVPKPMDKKKFHPMSPVQLLLRPSPWVETFCFFFFWCSRCFCHLGPKMHQNLWKKKVSPHVTCPASPQTLSMGRNFFFLVFSRLLPPWPKNVPKPMEKNKFHPMSPVQLPLRPSPWVETFCFFLFSRGCCNCKQYQLLFFCVFGFPVPWVPGRNFHLHWHSFHPSTFYIDVFIELLILATEPSEKMYSKNSSTLSPTSLGTPLDWCFIGMPRFWFLMFRGLARVLQTWNH